MSDTYLLKGATMGDLDAIRAICELKDYTAGDSILSEKGKDPDLMIVAKGRVRVESRDGELIDQLRVGDMIGEISFLDQQGRTANVFASGEAQVVVIPAEGLRDLMKADQRLAALVYRNAALALCRRLREANTQIGLLLVQK